MSVTSDQLIVMTDDQLIDFADQYLSIAIKRGTPRTKILTRIVNAAVSAKDGT